MLAGKTANFFLGILCGRRNTIVGEGVLKNHDDNASRIVGAWHVMPLHMMRYFNQRSYSSVIKT
jgi:hypothetical protein